MLTHYTDQDDKEKWSFDAITGHKTINRTPFVQILWDNGEKTWEPLSIIKQDDEITVAKYAIDNNLENTHG